MSMKRLIFRKKAKMISLPPFLNQLEKTPITVFFHCQFIYIVKLFLLLEVPDEADFNIL